VAKVLDTLAEFAIHPEAGMTIAEPMEGLTKPYLRMAEQATILQRAALRAFPIKH
jgi:hypothetical protein